MRIVLDYFIKLIHSKGGEIMSAQRCSECGFEVSWYERDGSALWKFCPNCGCLLARSVVVQVRKCTKGCKAFTDKCDYIAAFCTKCGAKLSKKAVDAAEKQMLPGAPCAEGTSYMNFGY